MEAVQKANGALGQELVELIKPEAGVRIVRGARFLVLESTCDVAREHLRPHFNGAAREVPELSGGVTLVSICEREQRQHKRISREFAQRIVICEGHSKVGIVAKERVDPVIVNWHKSDGRGSLQIRGGSLDELIPFGGTRCDDSCGTAKLLQLAHERSA